MGFQQIITAQEGWNAPPFVLGNTEIILFASGSAGLEQSAPEEFSKSIERERALRSQFKKFSAKDAMTNDELYDRW